MEKIMLGAGCFWCVEDEFMKIPGVVSTSCGYSGGHTENPTYKEVCTDKTGHAEVILVEFDPKVASLEKILDFFWEMHDPTTLNRQGPDAGTQYRSAIFYYTDAQKVLAEKSKKKAGESGKFKDPIVTEIMPAKKFYEAEEYHQKYYCKIRDKQVSS